MTNINPPIPPQARCTPLWPLALGLVSLAALSCASETTEKSTPDLADDADADPTDAADDSQGDTDPAIDAEDDSAESDGDTSADAEDTPAADVDDDVQQDTGGSGFGVASARVLGGGTVLEVTFNQPLEDVTGLEATQFRPAWDELQGSEGDGWGSQTDLIMLSCFEAYLLEDSGLAWDDERVRAAAAACEEESRLAHAEGVVHELVGLSWSDTDPARIELTLSPPIQEEQFRRVCSFDKGPSCALSEAETCEITPALHFSSLSGAPIRSKDGAELLSFGNPAWPEAWPEWEGGTDSFPEYELVRISCD